MRDLTETERAHLLSIRSQLSYARSLWAAEIATLDRLLAATPRKEVASFARVREVVHEVARTEIPVGDSCDWSTMCDAIADRAVVVLGPDHPAHPSHVVRELLAEIERLQSVVDSGNEAFRSARETWKRSADHRDDRIATLTAGLREACAEIVSWVESETQCASYEDDPSWQVARELRALTES